MAVGALLGLVSSLVNAAASMGGHDKTQDQLTQLRNRQRIPDSVKRAEAILREQAYMGLPGYEQRQAEIDASVPATMNQAKEFATGPGMFKMLSDIYTQSNKAHRDLFLSNEEAKMGNKTRLANFLGNQYAYQENRLSENLNEIDLAKIGEDQAKLQDKLNYAKYGTDSLISGIGDENKLLETLLGVLGGGSNNTGGGFTGGNIMDSGGGWDSGLSGQLTNIFRS